MTDARWNEQFTGHLFSKCVWMNGVGGGWTGWRVTLLWSSERNGRFIQGLRFAASLPVFCRPYGTFRLGLFYKTFWTDGEVTLLRSSIRSNVSLQGLRPSGYIPACILTSRWDFAFVLFHKTFWAAPRDNK